MFRIEGFGFGCIVDRGGGPRARACRAPLPPGAAPRRAPAPAHTVHSLFNQRASILCVCVFFSVQKVLDCQNKSCGRECTRHPGRRRSLRAARCPASDPTSIRSTCPGKTTPCKVTPVSALPSADTRSRPQLLSVASRINDVGGSTEGRLRGVQESQRPPLAYRAFLLLPSLP